MASTNQLNYVRQMGTQPASGGAPADAAPLRPA
jgi:hypothetical protein